MDHPHQTRWWRELHERLEKFFKIPLNFLKDQGYYDPHNSTHRHLLAYLMVPIMQKEIDTLVHVVWNSHRIRAQKNTFLPDGIPNHIYKLFSISIWCRGMWHRPYCLYAPFLLVNV